MSHPSIVEQIEALAEPENLIWSVVSGSTSLDDGRTVRCLSRRYENRRYVVGWTYDPNLTQFPVVRISLADLCELARLVEVDGVLIHDKEEEPSMFSVVQI